MLIVDGERVALEAVSASASASASAEGRTGWSEDLKLLERHSLYPLEHDYGCLAGKRLSD